MATIEVNVPDSADVFAKALAAFIFESKKAMEDGWQPTHDIPAILVAVLKDLVPAAGSLAAAKDDIKKDPFGSALALAIELKKVL